MAEREEKLLESLYALQDNVRAVRRIHDDLRDLVLDPSFNGYAAKVRREVAGEQLHALEQELAFVLDRLIQDEFADEYAEFIKGGR